jgi:hypothetical protein
VHDGSNFQEIVDEFAEEMVIFADMGFAKKDWHPDNWRLCKRGNVRMVVETALSMLTYICDFKHSRHKVWDYLESKLAFTMALFNILVQWHGFQPGGNGFVPLSIAEFSL